MSDKRPSRKRTNVPAAANNIAKVSGGTPSETTAPTPDAPIAKVVSEYVAAIRGIGLTARIALSHMAKWETDEVETTQKRLLALLPKGRKTFTVKSAREFAELSNTIRHLDDLRSQTATVVLAKSLFTQIFAEFDSYIGELLQAVYLKNDQLLKGISREISLCDLLDFDDINSAKRAILDKEIETFRRDSYVEQFATLERKFGLSLRKFKEWPEFVELSQRRNILTHNGGSVSEQYLAVCDKEGHLFDVRPRVGESLGVSIDYFAKALRLLSKVGVMLGYTLWGKVFPAEIRELHESLNATIFHGLEQKRWHLVAELQDFALSPNMQKDIPEILLRIRIVNTAIGLKFSDRNDEAARLLDSVDWTASYRDFKLALAVLAERYDEAVRLMRSIGRNGEMLDQTAYHTWPLFTRFRERPEFYEAYLDIYKEPFTEKIETSEGAVEAKAKGGSERATADPTVIDVVATAGTSKPSSSPEERRRPKTKKVQRRIPSAN